MNKIKVLIVEDDPMVAEITKEFIKEDPDYQVIGIAYSGAEAVAMVRQIAPELVLLDNFLPDFNGTQVIQQLRTFEKNLDFIMITAAKEVPLVQECFRLGIRDYLIKPYLKQRFLQALQHYKQFQATLNKGTVSQADLDQLSHTLKSEENFPKGFSQITEEKIMDILKTRAGDGVTAEEIAAGIGITTVSARRYLKSLQDRQLVTHELIYGKQGRPSYLFKIAGKNHS